MTSLIDPKKYTKTLDLLRSFFLSKNFLEVHTQNRLSILAACEDPETVASYNYGGNIWPLPQTGQMWLEHELLSNPSAEGFFCVSTSYRAEPNPVPGRHETIFPMFEFEMKGGIDKLMEMEVDLLEHLGYDINRVKKEKYDSISARFSVDELENHHEMQLYNETPTYFITHFPEHTSPFWNMKRNDEGTSNKVDVILSGHETIGSAERESDKEKMRECFNTIMDGAYKNKLYELFGEERTNAELDEYLQFDFFERCGGGIGVSRLMRSMKTENLI